MTDGRRKFDVAIVGAGVNGAGIAREAAMRGLSVAIFDKNDMCSGTSAASSRLIHGGLRYLEYGEIPLVYESLHERRYLRQIASHLVKPLRITIPVFASARRGRWLVRLGMIAYDILSFNKRLPRHKMLSRAEILSEEPGLNETGLSGAAQYSDAQVTFAERLVLENLLAARELGAAIRTYAEVTAIAVTIDESYAVSFASADGVTETIEAAAIVNAAGPWVDRVLGATAASLPKQVGGTKGSHIVVGKFKGSPKNAFYVEAAADGRPIFIIPWNDLYLIGTTDIRYDDDMDRIRASVAEIDYLLAETNRVFSDAHLDVGDIHYSYAGVRPLPFRTKGPESAITRRHIIKVNPEIGRRFVSIVGGKLTTYRNLARQTVDKLSTLLSRRLPASQSHVVKLPGAEQARAAEKALQEIPQFSESGRRRLMSVYGGRALAIVNALREEDSPISVLDDRTALTAAEIRFVIREEFPQTLVDIVFRRTMHGLCADQGRPIYAAIADVAAAELKWADKQRGHELDALIRFADSFLAPV